MIYRCQLLATVIVLGLITGSCSAAETTAATDELVMNDIRLSDYLDFSQKWPLVTVRYRTDTTELRFTYANPLANAVLQVGGTEYPDGAVFAKIGMMTADDPEFFSSKVPSGAKRFQFMVRDKAKYAATGGWGYAVFPARLPLSVPTETQIKADVATAQARFACHEIVKDRGYVFSQPANLRATYSMLTESLPPVTAVKAAPALRFVNFDVAALPEAIRRRLPGLVNQVRFLEGNIRKHVFRGTLGVLRPTLIAEASLTRQPAVFMAENQRDFTIVIPINGTTLPDGKTCPEGQKAFSTYSSADFTNITENFCSK